MNNLDNNKKVILVIMLVLLGIGGYYLYNNLKFNVDNEEKVIEDDILISENETDLNNAEKQKDNNKIIVHITGEVVNPGIVELEEGKRVYNAIELAGGVTKNADTSKINLAAVVEDGAKINVPNVNDKSEVNENSYLETTDNKQVKQNLENNIVNINTATQVELETLPGIGPAIAIKIINYRKEKGKFSKIEDIKNVNGIGESKYNNIKDLIKVK